jgi:tetratricopeptide (TPR) repeat protein
VLAEATATLGRRLADLGRTSQAVVTTQEAIALQRQLVESDGEQWSADLANTLCSLSRGQLALGRDAEARAAAEQAISLLRPRAAGEPACAGELARALRCLGQVVARSPDQATAALSLAEEAVAIRRVLHQSNPGGSQFHLADDLIELGWRLSAAGRGAEALPLTEEGLSIGRALMASEPDPRRLRLHVRMLMEYIWVRWEHGHELPEALARSAEVEQLLRLGTHGHEVADLGFTDIGHVLEVRASILMQLGRPEEARAVLRTMLDRKSADKKFLDSLKPIRHPMLGVLRLSDMAELKQPRGAEALAVQMVTAEEGSAKYSLARRLMRMRLRRENRASQSRLTVVPAGALADANALSTASLMADIMAFEAVDPARSIWSRRISAEKLARRGDPRGIEILVAQALDTGLKNYHRKEAARALTSAGDPRGRYLLADLLTTDATGTTAGLPAARQAAWPLTIQTRASGVLNGVSPAAAVALRRLSDRPAKPERSPRRQRLARGLAAFLLPLPPALVLFVGVSAAAARGSHPGPGNWIALCVSAYLLYVLAHEFMGSAGRFAARAFDMNPEARRYFFACYVFLMPISAVLGYILAHSVFGFSQPAATFLWDVLIWR